MARAIWPNRTWAGCWVSVYSRTAAILPSRTNSRPISEPRSDCRGRSVAGTQLASASSISKHITVNYTSVMHTSSDGGTPKPDRLFDRDTEWKGLVSFAADDHPGATLGVVSGRRRQ